MNSQEKSGAKFSHRLFAQYFASAIIPVIVLSSISFYTVSSLLEKNAKRQIYAESRAVGLTFYDRLLTLESNLISISHNIDDKTLLNSNAWIRKMYSSVYVINNDNTLGTLLFGEYIDAVKLTNTQKARLSENKSLLFFYNNKNQPALLMLHSLGSNAEQTLVAVLDAEYLWNITIKESDRFCAVVDLKQVVHCSSSADKNISNAFILDSLSPNNKNNLQEISINEKSYLGNRWDVFLDANFGVSAISIIYMMPKMDAMLDYNYYIDAFPLITSITLLVVFVLSSIQMRRSLGPLTKLTQATRNLVAGDFSKRVDVKSNDEFQTLAETFNDMSERINEQFNKIKSLAEIDRLILSTPDTDYIVEILIKYIPSVLSANNIAIMSLSAESSNTAVLIYNKDSLYKEMQKIEVLLSEDEIDELNHTEGVINKTDKTDCTYLNPLVKLGNMLFTVCPIRNKDEVLGAICIGFNDIEQQKNSSTTDLGEIAARAAVALSNANWEKKLLHQAHYDALTKLPNRYLFQDRLEQALERAKRNKLNVAVLFIDLDRFKSINDSLGHIVGDELLIEVSNLMLKCVRASDSVARFGGDEFIITVADVSADEIDQQVEMLSGRILELMSLPIVVNDREFYISPSIGIAIYPRDASNFNDLLRNADTAMYEAKGISPGNFQFYQKKQNKETLAQLELENDLRHALEKDQLQLFFQPKINLRNGMIYDVEALARWKHPEHGYVSPAVFIPLAEETGLITNIGYWVMRTACMQNKTWQDKGINLNVAVNVSTDQFRQPGLYEKIISIIDETGVRPTSIELEVTESITIEDFSKTVALLNKFKDYGLNICIDDFGTGYSSMTYLQKIPINKLKIDKSFIDNIHLDNDSAAITKAIVALAHNLSLRVVAEGVETKAQYEYLNAISCDEAQGFFLSKPLPEDELIKHILMYNSRSAKLD